MYVQGCVHLHVNVCVRVRGCLCVCLLGIASAAHGSELIITPLVKSDRAHKRNMHAQFPMDARTGNTQKHAQIH